MFGNVRSGLWNSFEIFGKWSEIFGKSSKTSSSLCVYKEHYTLARRHELNFMFSCRSNVSLVRCAHSETLFLPLEHNIHICSPPCNILSFTTDKCVFFLPSIKCSLLFKTSDICRALFRCLNCSQQFDYGGTRQ